MSTQINIYSDESSPPHPMGPQPPTEQILLLRQISMTNIDALGVLHEIKHLLKQIRNNMPTSATDFTALFAAITALINAKNADDTVIADLRGQLATLIASDASLNDPAFIAQVNALATAAAAATPDPNAPPVVVTPEA